VASVTDGLSNTVIFSEYLRGKNMSASPSDGLHQVYQMSQTLPTTVTTTSVDIYVPLCTATKTIVPSYDHKGQKWPNQACAEGGGYSHIMMPNTKACFFSNQNGNVLDTVVGASSNHSGGVNVVMLDGSVKFVKNSVSPTTWRALATRDKGEIIDASSY
jgi:prepilin-type processing-associated H-X9-DG protein